MGAGPETEPRVVEAAQPIATGVQPVEERRYESGESLVDPKEEVPQRWRGVAGNWSSQSGRKWPGQLALEEDGHQRLC